MAPATSAVEPDLSGTRVLVVEDDYFIATEICNALARRGARIIGPAADIAHGTALASSTRVDIAVLDINLHGELVFDFARKLRATGISAIFATGYDPGILPEDLAAITHLEKPVDLAELVRAVHASRTGALPAERTQ